MVFGRVVHGVYEGDNAVPNVEPMAPCRRGDVTKRLPRTSESLEDAGRN